MCGRNSVGKSPALYGPRVKSDYQSLLSRGEGRIKMNLKRRQPKYAQRKKKEPRNHTKNSSTGGKARHDWTNLKGRPRKNRVGWEL